MLDRLLHSPGPLRKQRAEIALQIRRFRSSSVYSDELEAMTGEDAIWWTRRIQEAIARSFRPNPNDPDHPLCDPGEWLGEILTELGKRRPHSYGAAALQMVIADESGDPQMFDEQPWESPFVANAHDGGFV